MRYDRIACLALVAGLAGCGVAQLRPAAPTPTSVWSEDTTTGELILGSSPDWAHEVQITVPAGLTPAFCRAYAPHVNEDEVPLTHNGARLVAYDDMDDIGCGTYADGWAYDGLGWIAPS